MSEISNPVAIAIGAVIVLLVAVVFVVLITNSGGSIFSFFEKSSYIDKYCADIPVLIESNKKNVDNYESVLINDKKSSTCLKAANKGSPSIVCEKDKCKIDKNYMVYQTQDYKDSDDMFCCVYTAGKKSETVDTKTDETSSKSKSSNKVICSTLPSMKKEQSCYCYEKSGVPFKCTFPSCDKEKIKTSCMYS